MKTLDFPDQQDLSILASRPSAGISVIVPSWDCGETLLRVARQWASLSGVREVIICTAGRPSDERWLEPGQRIRVCVSEEIGRGYQMNRGAELAEGSILLFHHADSILTQAHALAISRAMEDPAFIGGAFYRKFDARHPHLKCLENLERFHSRLFGTLYGDQSIFVPAAHFRQLGGYPRIPLMEDVAFSSRLRRSGKVTLLDPPMETSARKHLEEGAWRVTLRNILFLILFRCGVHPKRLHKWYYSTQARTEEP